MPEQETPIDGRTARAHRTRESIVDALQSLIEEGDLTPTAPRIAERAGVSLRSIYQHFDDLDSLFRDVAQRQFAQVTSLAVRLPRAGPLEERLDAFVAQRARILEAMTPLRRASIVHEIGSDTIRATRATADRRSRREVERVFAVELDRLDAPDRSDLLDALDVVAGWSSWERLRSVGHEPDEATRIIRRMMVALLDSVA